MKVDIVQYYFDLCFWQKMKKYGCKVGFEIVYLVLKLYYVVCDLKIFKWVCLCIYVVLGYFVLFLDVLFDFVFLVGYFDDLILLVFVVVIVVFYIIDDVKVWVYEKMQIWFGEDSEFVGIRKFKWLVKVKMVE